MDNQSDTQSGEQAEEVAVVRLGLPDPTPAKRPRGRPRKVRPEEVAPTDYGDVKWLALDGTEYVPAPASETPTKAYADAQNPVVIGAADVYRAEGEFMPGDYADPVLIPNDPPAVIRADLPQLDHDGDGHPGGSLPHAKLTDLQAANYARDMLEAHARQAQIIRKDDFNRVWTFQPETVKSLAYIMAKVERGPKIASRIISTAHFTQDHADAAVRDLDGETRE